ncbi:MAG: V-type ATP synthase subunit E family protein [Oscillospiraceae bacterium]
MQNIDSAERFNEFEQAVIGAAENEAHALIEGAEKERDEMLYKARHSVAKSDFDKLSFAAERWRLGVKASISQDSRRRLLLYRESLIDDLLNELCDKLKAFTQSKDYEAFLSGKLSLYESKIAKNSVIYCKNEDKSLLQKLCAQYDIAFADDDDIILGGFRLACDNLLYDETLDTARDEERGRLLSYCNLEVV